MAAAGPLLFLGSKQAGLRACARLCELLPKEDIAGIVCPDDRSDRRSVWAEFERLGLECGLPVRLAKSKAKAAELIRCFAPATAIVHGWYQILPVEEFPETAFLGFHYSPLPRYRGNAPLVWQIIEGEPEIGVSFFELTAEMDTGRLVEQRLAPLGPDETISDALDKADALVEEILARFAPQWISGSWPLSEQPDTRPSYCALRVPEDGRIDWSWSGWRIHDFIRAQTLPYPGAFSVLPDGRKLTILRSGREERRFHGAPGAVAEVADGHVVVAAGSGAVRLIEVQVEGEEARPVSHVLRSLRTRLG